MYIVDSQIANLRKRCFQIKEILVNFKWNKKSYILSALCCFTYAAAKNSWREGFSWCRKHVEELLSLFSEDTGSRKMSKYYVCESECSISTNKYHEKVPSIRIRFCSVCLKTVIFCSVLKKIRVHSLRFWIVISRLCENVILIENGTIFDGNMRCTGIQHRKVIVFKNLRFQCIHTSGAKQGFQNLVCVEGRANWRKNFVLKQKRIRVDRRGLTNGNPEADGALILAPLNSGALNHCFL